MRRFQSADLAEINSWYEARGRPPIVLSILPETGAIEPGVAAGFLYRTDSAIALLEGYVTNPEASSEARNKALDEIIEGLMEVAKELGVQQLIALTHDKGIEKRANRHGLKLIGKYVMVGKAL